MYLWAYIYSAKYMYIYVCIVHVMITFYRAAAGYSLYASSNGYVYL